MRRAPALCGIALSAFSCRAPEASRMRTHDAAIAPAPVSSTAAERPPSESEALALVRALPAVKKLASFTLVAGSKSHPAQPVAHVATSPRADDPERDSWLIAVGDRDVFVPDGGVAQGYEPDYWVRVAAGGRITIRTAEQARFRDYASWAERDRRREQLIALVHSTPEWQARASEVERAGAPYTAGSAYLGLVCGDDFEPGDCTLDDTCRLRCDAIRLCDGCAGGRWLTFELGAARRTLQIEDEDVSSPTSAQLLPYGQWRNRFRAAARRGRDPAYRALADPRRSFPDHHAGEGEFGYGTPASTSATPSSGLRAVLEQGGLGFVRIEHYGTERFPVVLVTGKPSVPQERLRSWGSQLVRSVGGRACELALGPAERYQFDRFAAERANGGVYRFVDGAFHPWVANDD